MALELLPLSKDVIEPLTDVVIDKKLTKYEARRLVRINSRSVNGESEEKKGTISENELHLLDRTLRKTIATLKSSLVNFDDIIEDTNDRWILKELLMQYRQILHGDIDTFLKLRKKIAMKIPREYLAVSSVKFAHDPDYDDKEILPIHVWLPKGIWQ